MSPFTALLLEISHITSSIAAPPSTLATIAALTRAADTLSIAAALPALTRALRSGHPPHVRAALGALA
jgi:hypothetical protein